jgi:hypothetical protein
LELEKCDLEEERIKSGREEVIVLDTGLTDLTRYIYTILLIICLLCLFNLSVGIENQGHLGILSVQLDCPADTKDLILSNLLGNQLEDLDSNQEEHDSVPVMMVGLDSRSTNPAPKVIL